MAGFNGFQFVFDGVPSSTYGLCLAEFDPNGFKTNSAGSNVTLIEDGLPRRTKPYFYGVVQNEKLQFEISITNTKGLDRRTVAVIQKWLFGQTRYKKLQVVQCDMDDMYFNCMLKNADIITIGNIPYGFTCTVECDAPWGWEFPRTSVFSTQEVETNLQFYNSSDDSDYLYPIINFKLDTSTTDVSVINLDDNNRASTFTGLLPSETIYINNDLEIITSSTGLNRLKNFNGKYFRFRQGLNRIRIIGGLTTASVTYQFARKVGS